MGSIMPADGKLHPKQPRPPADVDDEDTESAVPRAQEGDESDSEDDGSTEGDHDEGKVLGSDRPPEGRDTVMGVGLGGDKAVPPLTEYIINVVHFLDSILSNNSTDDHMKEFVSQGGMQPLLRLLSLPVLPLDFPSSAACTAITGACRSIMVSLLECQCTV